MIIFIPFIDKMLKTKHLSVLARLAVYLHTLFRQPSLVGSESALFLCRKHLRFTCDETLRQEASPGQGNLAELLLPTATTFPGSWNSKDENRSRSLDK